MSGLGGNGHMVKRKAFDPGKTRTVALVGHRSAGKTSLGEVILRTAGVTRVVGSVERRTALLDHHEEERRRGLSLQLSYAWLEWEEHQINLIDTPGSDVVPHERSLGLAAADAALVVLDAAAGLQVGAEVALEEAAEGGLPVLALVNKVERPHDLQAVVEELQSAVDSKVVPLFLPFEEEGRLCGLVSVLDRQVLRYDPDGEGTFSPEPVPLSVADALRSARERLAEAVALTDDELLEHYLEFLELPSDLLREGLVAAVRSGGVVPVIPVSAALRIGAQPLLDAIVALLPSPAERRPPVAHDADGAPVEVRPDGRFVAQLVSTHLDEEGQRYHVLRIWSGSPPRGGWTRVPADPADALPQRRPGGKGGRGQVRVARLYQVRGPRRAAARTVGPGALLATWDPLPARPGDTFTDGPQLRLPVPAVPPPMMTYLVRPADPVSPRALERLQEAARDLAQQDVALRIREEELLGGVLLSGLGQGHLELAVERLRARYAADLVSELPPVAYRETPRGAVANIQGLHVREGGDGLVHEYGLCTVDVNPGSPDAGVSFHDTLPPDDVDILPAKYRPAIDEGVRLASAHGPTAGYPVVGLEVTLTGGEYDILQSTDDHFRRAGEKALRTALARAGTRLLEPWSRVEIVAPQAAVGDILSDISSHRGRILGMELSDGDGRRRGGEVRIEALCPYRELRTFASRLQSHTHGRGRFCTRHSHYEPLPRHLEGEAIADSPFLDRRVAQQDLGLERT